MIEESMLLRELAIKLLNTPADSDMDVIAANYEKAMCFIKKSDSINKLIFYNSNSTVIEPVVAVDV